MTHAPQTDAATLPLHRPETAGRLAVRQAATARPEETADGLRRRLAALDPAHVVDPVPVADRTGHYLGAISLARLVAAKPETPAQELADPHWPSVDSHADQEHAAEMARAAQVPGLPVVTRDGRVIGCIPAARLLDVLWREHTEDIHRLAGIMKPIDEARQALDQPPPLRATRRLPWLLVGLVGSSVATGVMASFEKTFEGNVKLAFFVPAIVYLADAIGTQTEAVAVRGLSVSKKGFAALLFGEMATGALIGLVLSALVLAGVALSFGDMRLALAVSVAVLAAGTIATSVGLTLPWVLRRFGLDPALGSGPLATIIQDVLSIVIYVATATLLVG